MEKVLRAVRNEATGITVPGSRLHTSLMAEVEALSKRKEVEDYGKNLPEHVYGGVVREWQALILSAQQQVASQAGGLNMSMDAAPIVVDLPRFNVRDPSIWDRIKTVNIDAMAGGGLAYMAANALVWSGVSVLSGGLIPILIGAGAALGAAAGLIRITGQQLEAAKNELRKGVTDMLSQCRAALCQPDLKHGKQNSPVDEFIETAINSVDSMLSEQFMEKQRQLADEEHSLEEKSQLAGERLAAAMNTVEQRLAQCDDLARRAAGSIAALREMQAALDQEIVQDAPANPDA